MTQATALTSDYRSAGPAGEAASTPRLGTQSLSRGIRLMRIIAAKPEFGWRLSDLADICKQDKATVHRMLACLVEERMVEQRITDKHYVPGPLMYELGIAHTQRFQFQRTSETALQAFSKRRGGIALLLLRSGNEYVCSVRTGLLTLQGLMVHPGTRRPLFTSVGGIAIMQTLSESDVHAILEANIAHEIWFRGSTRLDALRRMRERSDRHGFGVNLGDVVPGVHAFAVPVYDTRGHAFAALCLMGTAELYGEEKIPAIHAELLSVAADLTAEARTLSL